MRGLKPRYPYFQFQPERSHLLQMRGLKLLYPYFCPGWEWSHLLQMRGLKPVRNPGNRCYVGSHLLQMRGLKPNSYRPKNKKQRRIFYRCVDWNFEVYNNLKQRFVASFTDAWIETRPTRCCRKRNGCRIFYRCVDWNKTKAESASALQVASFTDAWIETNRFFVSLSNPFMSHLLQMRGLKPGVTYLLITCIGSHLLQMRGLKHRRTVGRLQSLCRIFYRCVDWNNCLFPVNNTVFVASFTDAWIET